MQIWVVVGARFGLIGKMEDEGDRKYAGCRVALKEWENGTGVLIL